MESLDSVSMGFLDPVSQSRSGSGSRRAKMSHKHRKKKVNKFHFLRAVCSLLRAKGFSCSLDVL
jgi:hypothetical protein